MQKQSKRKRVQTWMKRVLSLVVTVAVVGSLIPPGLLEAQAKESASVNNPLSLEQMARLTNPFATSRGSSSVNNPLSLEQMARLTNPFATSRGSSSVTNRVQEPVVQALPFTSGQVGIMAIDKSGDGQTIQQGQFAKVSLRISSRKDSVWIAVRNASGQWVTGTTYSNQPADAKIEYTWQTTTSTPPGTYQIKFGYSGTTTEDFFSILVVILNPNKYIDTITFV